MTSTTSLPPKLINTYYQRQVGTSKECCMCMKLTTTCLSNLEVSDFLYCCPSHLNDRGFASLQPSTPTTPTTTTAAASTPSTVSQAEIDKVKKEYEDKQERKKTNAELEKNKDKSWLSTGLSSIGSLATSAGSLASSSLFPPPPSPSSTPPPPSSSSTSISTGPKVYTLHRDIFRMRQDQSRKKWEKLQAKKRLEGLSLPSAPRGGLRPVGP